MGDGEPSEEDDGLDDGSPDPEQDDDNQDDPEADESPDDSEESGDDVEDTSDEPDDLGGDPEGVDQDSDDGSSTGSEDSSGGDTASDGGDDNGIKTLEDGLFEDLTDEQKAIRNRELKEKFINLYVLANSFKVKIDNISKNPDNLDIIVRANRALDRLIETINFYITKTYDTKTYIENKSDFYYCLWILDRIEKLISSLIPDEPK